MTITASAPGKLFLSGEWAILAGAPAVVCAVDRRARVTITSDAEPLRCISLVDARTTPLATAPQFGDAGAVAAAWRATGARLATGVVTVDARPFVDGTQKIGLGRSAAVLVAATAMFLDGQGVRDPVAIRRAALVANHEFQGGRGSGADIAVAVAGGIVEVRPGRDDLQVTPRSLPGPWQLLAGFTGTGAATVPLLDRLADAASPPPSLAALCAVADDAARAIAAGDITGFTRTFEATTHHLAALGDALGQPIVTPALRRLVAAAAGVGVAAKPSGAGGGDCGIALAASRAHADAVREAWQLAGIVPLTLSIDPRGVAGG